MKIKMLLKFIINAYVINRGACVIISIATSNILTGLIDDNNTGQALQCFVMWITATFFTSGIFYKKGYDDERENYVNKKDFMIVLMIFTVISAILAIPYTTVTIIADLPLIWGVFIVPFSFFTFIIKDSYFVVLANIIVNSIIYYFNYFSGQKAMKKVKI